MPITAVNRDVCGGPVNATGAKFTITGKPVVLLGDATDTHASSPHDRETLVGHMNQGSSKVTVGGIKVCFNGHSADCQHRVIATGAKVTIAS